VICRHPKFDPPDGTPTTHARHTEKLKTNDRNLRISVRKDSLALGRGAASHAIFSPRPPPNSTPHRSTTITRPPRPHYLPRECSAREHARTAAHDTASHAKERPVAQIAPITPQPETPRADRRPGTQDPSRLFEQQPRNGNFRRPPTFYLRSPRQRARLYVSRSVLSHLTRPRSLWIDSCSSTLSSKLIHVETPLPAKTKNTAPWDRRILANRFLFLHALSDRSRHHGQSVSTAPSPRDATPPPPPSALYARIGRLTLHTTRQLQTTIPTVTAAVHSTSNC
jgi:hypothetical protein